MFKIYKITNKVNGMIYIGKTQRTAHGRLSLHAFQKRSALFFPIKKYGIDNFSTEVLKENLSAEEARCLEKELTISLGANIEGKGYNVSAGSSHAEKTKKKIKKTSKKRIFSREQLINIQLMGLARKGVKASEETKKKLSESHIGQKAWNAGKKLSEEHRASLSAAKIGKKLSDSHKLAIKEAHLKRKEK